MTKGATTMEGNIKLSDYISKVSQFGNRSIIYNHEWEMTPANAPDWYKAYINLPHGAYRTLNTYMTRFYGNFTVTDCKEDAINELIWGHHETITSDFCYMFDYKLGKEYESMFYEYNPLENYNGEETETIHDIGSGTDNNTKTGSIDSTNSGNDKTTIKNNQTKNVTNSGSDITETKNNQSEILTYSGEDSTTNEKKQTETITNSGMDIVDVKNNQSVTITDRPSTVTNSHNITSYASNEIDSTTTTATTDGTNTTSYDGDADETTTTHGLTTTKEYSGNADESVTSYGQTQTKEYSGGADEMTTIHGHKIVESFEGNADETTTTHGLKNVTTYNNVVDNGTNTHNNTVTRTLTKKGNLGVTTSQQMLMSERLDASTFSFWQMLADMYVAFICDYV